MKNTDDIQVVKRWVYEMRFDAPVLLEYLLNGNAKEKESENILRFKNLKPNEVSRD